MTGSFPPALLAWVLLQAAGVVLVLGRVSPIPLPWAQASGWFAGVAAAEAALALLVWPAAAWPTPRGLKGAGAALGQGALLALLSMPLLVPSARISLASGADLAAALAGVAGLGSLGAGLRAWGRTSRAFQASAQGLLLLLAALPPWLAFLGEVHASGGLRGLAWISPVWGAALGGSVAWLQAISAAALGAALAASAPAEAAA